MPWVRDRSRALEERSGKSQNMSATSRNLRCNTPPAAAACAAQQNRGGRSLQKRSSSCSLSRSTDREFMHASSTRVAWTCLQQLRHCCFACAQSLLSLQGILRVHSDFGHNGGHESVDYPGAGGNLYGLLHFFQSRAAELGRSR